MTPLAVHHFSVRVRLLDALGNTLAESNQQCQALDPAAACVSVFSMARADFHARGMAGKVPNAEFVSFLVGLAKGRKR